MIISEELFSAILAMGAFNRGYNSGIGGQEGLGEIGNIGNATLITRVELGVTQSAYEGWQNFNFFASAYRMDGETIISYRGTDVQPGLFPPTLGDAATGWPIGAGIIEGTQVDLARTDRLCSDFRQDHLQDMTGSG